MQNEQKVRSKIQFILLSYMVFLSVLSLILWIYWDILRQQAGYETIFPAVGASKTMRFGQAAPVLLPILPVIGLFLSLKSPEVKWHLNKWAQVFFVHGLPLLIIVGSVAVFLNQYQQLQEEKIRYERKLEFQQELLKLQQELREQEREEKQQMIENISRKLEEAAEGTQRGD